MNMDFFYPPLDAEVPEHYYAIGREVCRRCKVWEQCLEDGEKEVWGMWGGLTPNERSVFSSSRVKVNALKPHGSWLRYRQGCRCEECRLSQEEVPNPINTKAIPRVGQPVGDLSAMRFEMLFPTE
jgi:hypothetical protein